MIRNFRSVMSPGNVVATATRPGCSRANLMNSSTECTGSDGETASTIGTSPMKRTGTKSFTSNGKFECMTGKPTKVEATAMKNVDPSGRATAAFRAAIKLPAPG